MPFGFSTGDFIAAVNLVRDPVKALHDSNGSSREYRELIRELHNLETVLLEVKARPFPPPPSLSTLDNGSVLDLETSSLRRLLFQCRL
jgi:hypothetical protein